MVNHFTPSVQQPVIAKYVQPYRNGIQSYNLTRHGIGYVLRGKKYIYDGDIRHQVNRGDIFFLNAGHHYIEDIPENGKPFEQIIFYYTPAQLARILSQLSLTYQMEIVNNHSCDNCRESSHVIYPASNNIRNFFSTTNQYIKDELFTHDETAENLKMTELIYLIVSQEDNCIKSKIMANADSAKESFEQIVFAHIFAVWWTLSRAGVLLDGESGHFLPFDALNGFVLLPFGNFFLRIRTWWFFVSRPRREWKKLNTTALLGSILAVLLAVVLVKISAPAAMDKCRDKLLDLMGGQTDFRAAFSAVGRAVSGQGAVGQALNDAYTAVFGPQQTVPEGTADPAAYSAETTPGDVCLSLIHI